MIEGLLTYPWLQEAAGRDRPTVGHLLDCKKCKEMNGKQTRQALGCGYELPDPRVPVQPWSPAGMSSKWDTEQTVCPGYTRSMPEVVEIVRAKIHWEKGALDHFCAGLAPERVLEGVEIAASAIGEVESWRITPSKDGGGGS